MGKNKEENIKCANESSAGVNLLTTPIRSLIFQQQSLTISFGMQKSQHLQNEKKEKNIQMNLNAHITKNVSWDGWYNVYKKIV